LQELIAKWDKPPIHIKEAIKALLQTPESSCNLVEIFNILTISTY
jgi:hypothetical protein